MTTIYLFDPRLNVQETTTLENIVQFSGLTRKTVLFASRQRRRITPTGCYLSREPIPSEERKRLHALESFPDEVWRDIPGYDGGYQVSDHGRVRSRRHGGPNWELMTPYPRERSNLHVKLRRNGDVRHVPVAHLVMDAFLGAPGPEEVIIHKNNIIYDNHVNNLVYIHRTGLGKRFAKFSTSKPVYKVDPVTGEVLDEYVSIREAAKENFMGSKVVRNTCQGKRPDAFGLRFCYGSDYGKPIHQLDPFTREVEGEYPNAAEAAYALGLDADSIRAACQSGTAIDGMLFGYAKARSKLTAVLV